VLADLGAHLHAPRPHAAAAATAPRAQARGMTAASREAVLQFMCRINDAPTDPTGDPTAGYPRYTRYLDGDPARLDSDTRVVVDGEDEEIVATLRVWRRLLRLGSTPVPVGGIGGVGTDPAFQGRGHATALMRDAAVYMAAQGFEVGCLFSAIPARFYRRCALCRAA
jgi:ribosomal protein S18 acetylase RimI-like enzyme